jgi:hypothetical protein
MLRSNESYLGFNRTASMRTISIMTMLIAQRTCYLLAEDSRQNNKQVLAHIGSRCSVKIREPRLQRVEQITQSVARLCRKDVLETSQMRSRD